MKGDILCTMQELSEIYVINSDSNIHLQKVQKKINIQRKNKKNN